MALNSVLPSLSKETDRYRIGAAPHTVLSRSSTSLPAGAPRNFSARRRDHVGTSVCAVLIAAGILTGQTPANAPAVGRRLSFYHREGDRNVAHFTAAEAVPQGISIYLARNFHMETFREKDGSEELLIDAPECLFDATTKRASSPGPIRVRQGDGLFVLEGVGFQWDQENSRLVVSNQVHTVIQKMSIIPHSP